MNSKKLIGMAVALVVLAGIAILQKQGGKRRHEKSGPVATLLQGVDLNTLDALEIVEGSNTVSLAKRDGKWVVESLFNYPVDFGRLADAMRAASEIEMGKPVRASNIDASEYGMDEARSIVLKTGGKEAVRLEVGARREASDAAGWANQRFVRKDGGGDIHLVDYDFRPFSDDSPDWIDKQLLNVRSAEIVSVEVGDVELKEDAGEWELVDLDGEREEFQSSEANKLRMAIQYLNCNTVVDPAMSDTELGFTNAIVYTAQTTNKTYTAILGGETENGRYIRFEGDVPERLNGWTYVVSTYEAADFLIPRDMIVKAKEPPAEEVEDEEIME